MANTKQEILGKKITPLLQNNLPASFFVKHEEIENLLLTLLKVLQSKVGTGIIVNARMPFTELTAKMFKEDMRTSDFFFVDITAPKSQAELPEVYYTAGFQSLTELAIILNSSITSESVNYILLDSITEFFKHHAPSTVMRFIKYLLQIAVAFEIPIFFIGEKNVIQQKDYDQVKSIITICIEL
jgi:hypothetical protein